ncbi:hypothetical protein BGX31_001378 [Mortierella sp. GBA43]|nr:hypothetical protein BGX31_001378 [Mortierella sp. GBA43]
MAREELPDGKLSPKYQGPFKVMARTQNGAYTLLDATNQEIARNYAPEQLKRVTQALDAPSDESYEVESILGHELTEGGMVYKVKWKGFDSSHNENVPYEHFDSDLIIRQYWKRLKQQNPHVIAKQAKKDERARKKALQRIQAQQKPITHDSTKSNGKRKPMPRRKRGQAKQERQTTVSVVAHSELCSLNIDLTDCADYKQVLEWVQWDHLRQLCIEMDGIEIDGQSDTDTIVKAITGGSRGFLNMDYFKVGYHHSEREMTDEVAKQFRSALSSAKLQHLEIDWIMTGTQVLDLIKSMDLSRLEYLKFRADKMGGTEMQTALDMLRLAPELQNLHLVNATVTKKQAEQMRANGIAFRNHRKR